MSRSCWRHLDHLVTELFWKRILLRYREIIQLREYENRDGSHNSNYGYIFIAPSHANGMTFSLATFRIPTLSLSLSITPNLPLFPSPYLWASFEWSEEMVSAEAARNIVGIIGTVYQLFSSYFSPRACGPAWAESMIRFRRLWAHRRSLTN